ncbi:hydrolase 1, exosortase A system-associated [Arsukibacterium sp.]|uniref:hydrolase 1, exosortase A system-associated n=1 Tax=Arsukibacterium sp. TaxID=1977258 RepID=UPI002FDA41C7
MNESYIQFRNNLAELSGILHYGSGHTGVLIIVGGPQYRVGSHRQFVKLSRALAIKGIASMRFDTSGMGDSSGKKTVFYQQTIDIELAIEQFFLKCPHLKQLVLWGLCDAASAILIKLNRPDPRISGVVLLNPWVRQTQSHAQTMLRHYYLKRLVSPQFWQKLFKGGLKLKDSLLSFSQTLSASREKNKISQHIQGLTDQLTEQTYVMAMLKGWQGFNGKTLVITSGNDLTAQEFLSLCQSNSLWQQQLNSSQHQHCSEANHTFSTGQWRQHVEQQTISFLSSLY